MELLRAGRVDEAAALAVASARAQRFLAQRLWDGDGTVAATSAAVLGAVAARDAERGRELIRRFLWALNDESATNAGPVVLALAAMAERAPQVVRPYMGALLPLLEDEGLAAASVEVIARLVRALPEAAPELTEAVQDRLAALPPHLAAQLRAVLGMEV